MKQNKVDRGGEIEWGLLFGVLGRYYGMTSYRFSDDGGGYVYMEIFGIGSRFVIMAMESLYGNDMDIKEIEVIEEYESGCKIKALVG